VGSAEASDWPQVEQTASGTEVRAGAAAELSTICIHSERKILFLTLPIRSADAARVKAFRRNGDAEKKYMVQSGTR